MNVAVVGATGAVGREITSAVFRLGLKIDRLVLMSSERSAGKLVDPPIGEVAVELAEPKRFEGMDVVFFAAGAAVSRELAPQAVAKGAVVIDNSSAFRMDPNVPLVVPEINIDAVKPGPGIIANPNCSTIIALMPVAPIHRRWGVKRMIVSTYQAVSGAGWAAMQALTEETKAALEGAEVVPTVIPYKAAEVHHQIAFNVVPHVDVFLPDGYTKEEHKMVDEARKILNEPDLKISATTVRVPVYRSHSESINIETSEHAPLDEVRALLEQSPGVKVVDDPGRFRYPMPLEASGTDDVYVGRLRVDPSSPNSMRLWVVGDQLLKGAATNAAQIALGLLG